MVQTSRLAKPKFIMIACRNCLQKTKHDVLREYASKVTLEPPEPEISFVDRYQIVRCRGCEEISFVHAAWNDDDIDEDGNVVMRVKVYPYRMSGLKTIDGIQYLPDSVKRVYEETHAALAADVAILGAIGVRATIEAICNDKRAAGSGLNQKIAGMVKAGWLSPKQADFLHESRLLGNVAAHEMKPPPISTLRSALRIVENLLETVYVLPAVDLKMGAQRRHTSHN